MRFWTSFDFVARYIRSRYFLKMGGNKGRKILIQTRIRYRFIDKKQEPENAMWGILREKSILYVPKEDLGEDKYVMES